MKTTTQNLNLSILLRFICVFALLLSPLLSLFTVETAKAAGITTRSLRLDPNGSVGGSDPGGVVDHRFDINLPTNSPIGAIRLAYCTTAGPDDSFPTCTAPTGIDTAAVGFSHTTGVNGYTASSYDADPGAGSGNGVLLALGSPSAATSGQQVFTLTDIQNPSAANETFYVWITTYSDIAGTVAVDSGTVAASTAEPIDLTGQMPEALTFCTGESIPLAVAPPNAPDCANATSGDIGFDILFDPFDTAIANSQMAASTNAGDGYSITVQGATMTNGANTIAAMGTPGASTPGAGQFGFNLVENTDVTHQSSGTCVNGAAGPYPCVLGADIGSGYLGGGVYNGVIDDTYDDPDTYYHNTAGAEVVATSNSDVSDLEIYTVSYIVNVSGSQPAGTYSTTLTYVCTGLF